MNLLIDFNFYINFIIGSNIIIICILLYVISPFTSHLRINFFIKNYFRIVFNLLNTFAYLINSFKQLNASLHTYHLVFFLNILFIIY